MQTKGWVRCLYNQIIIYYAFDLFSLFDPAILDIGMMLEPASSDKKQCVDYSLMLSKF